MNHAVGRWLKVGVLTFVTAALVACAGAAGKPGEPGQAGEPGAPGAPAELPPLRVGMIGDRALEVAETETVPLAGYFSEAEGEPLTYAAASSAEAFAIVSVSESESTLTVTAVAAGSAVITVTATDADSLTAKQTFNVTVTAAEPIEPPEPPDDPDAITLDVTGTKEITVEEGQDVLPGSTGIATVTKKDATTWVVTAEAKGPAELRVYEGANLVRTITVTVNNQAPTRTAKTLDAEYYLVEVAPMDDDKDPVVKADSVIEKAMNYGANVYKIKGLELGDFFMDPDDDDLDYTVTSERPRDAVVAGWRKGGSAVYVDVLDAEIVHDFVITVTAKDNDKTNPLDATASLQVTVNIEPVLAQDYVVKQNPVTYDLKEVKVGYRPGKTHTLTFNGGLRFAIEKEKMLGNQAKPSASTEGTALIVAPDKRTLNASWWEITGNNVDVEKLVYVAVDKDHPHHKLSFQLEGVSATDVTIKWNVIKVEGDGTNGEKLVTVMKKVQLNVQRVAEAPVVVD